MNINLIHGNITEIPADVIVNSANKELWKGSGVCGAIHFAAGPKLEKECLAIKKELCPDGLSVGEVMVTAAYKLPATYVFHTVGPRQRKDEINLLKKCYSNCIERAEELKQKSISFPAISTNIYGVPIEVSARMVKEVIDGLKQHEHLTTINLVFFKKEDLEVYERIMRTRQHNKETSFSTKSS